MLSKYAMVGIHIAMTSACLCKALPYNWNRDKLQLDPDERVITKVFFRLASFAVLFHGIFVTARALGVAFCAKALSAPLLILQLALVALSYLSMMSQVNNYFSCDKLRGFVQGFLRLDLQLTSKTQYSVWEKLNSFIKCDYTYRRIPNSSAARCNFHFLLNKLSDSVRNLDRVNVSLLVTSTTPHLLFLFIFTGGTLEICVYSNWDVFVLLFLDWRYLLCGLSITLHDVHKILGWPTGNCKKSAKVYRRFASSWGKFHSDVQGHSSCNEYI